MTERVWRYAEEANVPRIVRRQPDGPPQGRRRRRTERPDRRSASSAGAATVFPSSCPSPTPRDFTAWSTWSPWRRSIYTPGGDGRGKVTGEIPASLAADAKARHEALVELVAEGKDELMEEYFEKGTIPEEHLITALHEAIREDRIFPVLFSSGLANMAMDHLLDFIKVYAPSPVERAPIAGPCASL